MKKFLSIILCLAVMPMLTACNVGNKNADVRIGIIQFAEHPALDNCREGFQNELKEKGIDAYVDYQNASASVDMAQNIAAKMVAEKYDLIVAIATPAAQAAYNAALGTDIPVVYIAVSDPVAAGLTGAGANCTGVSDALDIAGQIALMKQYVPNAKKVGVLYSSNEVNSSAQLLELLQVCMEEGIGLESAPVESVNDVKLALASILPKVDVIVNLLDNTVVSAMDVIVRDATAAKIPIIGSEEEQVSKGAIASQGYDYTAVGAQAAALALRIFEGEKATDIPFEPATGTRAITNPLVLTELGLGT